MYLKNSVFWEVTPCGPCKSRCFGDHSASIIMVTRIGELGTTLAVTSNRHTLRRNTKYLRLIIRANVVPSLPILVTRMMEALSSSERSVLTRTAQRNIPEDTVLHSHRHENLKFYMYLHCTQHSFWQDIFSEIVLYHTFSVPHNLHCLSFQHFCFLFGTSGDCTSSLISTSLIVPTLRGFRHSLQTSDLTCMI
jgi:hypothetical protein